MIKFKRLNNVVKVDFTLPMGWTVTLQNERNSDFDAELLLRRLDDDLRQRIEKIRRDAYNLGWKEAKGKKVKKRDWFNGYIGSDFI